MSPLHVVSIITIITCKSKYLLVQRSLQDDMFPGKWQNLGGKVELGERLEEAIAREIYEEVGLEIDTKPQFVMSYSWKKDEESPVRLGIIFLITLLDNISEIHITLSEELESYGWFTKNELMKLDTIGPESPTGTIGQILAIDTL